jgi:hypothetical protein
VNPEWVKAGVQALKDTWAEAADTDEDFAAAVIAAVEPLIRADERRKARNAEAIMGYMREAVHEARDQIAADAHTFIAQTYPDSFRSSNPVILQKWAAATEIAQRISRGCDCTGIHGGCDH